MKMNDQIKASHNNQQSTSTKDLKRKNKLKSKILTSCYPAIIKINNQMLLQTN